MAIGAFRQGETVPDLCANQPVSRVLANPFLGENAAVLAKSRGQRTARHAVEQASRRWRAGHDAAAGGEQPRAETRRDDLIQALYKT